MKNILSISLNPAIDVSCDAQSVSPTRKIRTHHQTYEPGGCGVNVARVIATLGGMTDLLYLSGGATGAVLDQSLSSLPVRLHPVSTRGMTRISYTVHELESGLEYRFVPEGSPICMDEIEQALKFIDQCDFDFIVLSGSLPKDSPPDTYARISEISARKNALIILDSSGMALKDTLDQRGIFLVKPSLGELEQLVGRKLNRLEAIQESRSLVERGAAQNVVVSMGSNGAILVNALEVLDVQAPHVIVRSAVGAGDSFVGAMSFALACGVDVGEAFHFGVAAGSAAVMTAGTQLCRREDVWRLYRDGSQLRGITNTNQMEFERN